jgi:branched-chain amino acid aminotransferase
METEIYHNILIHNSQLIDKNSVDTFDYSESLTIYEVIRLIDGIPLFFEDHLKRLHYSANLSGYEINLNDYEIYHSIKQLSIENQVLNGNIKLLFQFQNNQLTSFYCFFIKHNYPNELQYLNGVNVKLISVERQNPNAKIIDISYKQKLNSFIEDSLIYEALLVNKNGWITEGSKSNVFFLKNNLLFTAPKSLILPGITRKIVLKLANLAKVDIIEECVNQKDIRFYDAVFISGTSPKILPIASIDNYNFNVNHPLLKKIMDDYNFEIENYILKR